MSKNKQTPVIVYLMSTQTFLLVAVLSACIAYACRNSKADDVASPVQVSYQETIKPVTYDRPTVQQTGNQQHATLFSVTKEIVLFTWDYIF